MIDDMALLKQEMEQMDAEDPVVAQAAKDRAAQTLSSAKLSFSKLGDLIEQRRLLLRPRIVTNIKRMDQPGMLGDAAFRDAGSALRREGQSFRQIAEALELNARPASRYELVAQESDPPPDGGRAAVPNGGRAAGPNAPRVAGRDGARAACLRMVESAPFHCAHCFLSVATSLPVHRDRTCRHVAVLRRAWLCFSRPASFGIFRRRRLHTPQRGQR